MTAGSVATMLGVLLCVVAVLGPWLVGTASRLDRLHIRTDAAWAGLDSALARRAVVARALAAAGCLTGAAALRTAADRAERADRDDREAAESELTRLLGALDRQVPRAGLVAELVEAEQRLVLARRVYNDAVRDTRALRRGRLVRWLRLAGTAAQPEYFEIAEPEAPVPAPARRRSARLVLANGAGRVLLFHGSDPARPTEPFWFTPGGGVHGDEALRSTAVRELREETGLRVDESDLVGPTWVRRATFSFNGKVHHGEEWFFLLRVDELEVDTSGFTALEVRTVDGHRWWTAPELVATSDAVYPEQLADLLPGLLAQGWDGHTRTVR